MDGLFFSDEGWAADKHADVYSAATASNESGSADAQTFEEILDDSYKLTGEISQLRAGCSKRIEKLAFSSPAEKILMPTHQVGVVAPPAALAILPGEILPGDPTTDAIIPADSTPKAKRAAAGSTRMAPPAKKVRGTIRNYFNPL